jgi:hypothetical protein
MWTCLFSVYNSIQDKIDTKEIILNWLFLESYFRSQTDSTLEQEAYYCFKVDSEEMFLSFSPKITFMYSSLQ